ncbi:HD domain-containing protein [Actinoplanes sp. RD1]|uniref:HD domain-containing protein n=1 Tax=Actinoplanes sp. RD1 TaxID=3064538 RepID=UPI0027421A72|nr:hypothetical protein [Actinoplanes sp. RD1]
MSEWGLLGDVLAESSEGHASVRKATEEAAALLTTVRDTFPAYTLHDERHALNVVDLMNKLASPRIEHVNPLEAALLILSAYFHDIGMVYSDEDREAIPHEEEFERFLKRDPDAFLAVHRNAGAPTTAVLEKYCRERHAERVRVHLDRLDLARPGLLDWEGMSLVDTLHRLCRSHNEPAATLLTSDFGEFLGTADLRFCAMLLRLADIMDFGRSRAPRIIHDYLGLATPGSAAAAESAEHWQKQMHSRGFLFPSRKAADWPEIYQLGYAANPRDPSVEHAIRSSLQDVRTELQLCRPARDQCREELRRLPLPGEIDTRQIESKGYTYGGFRFELDRSSVLEMFTGEELYEDRYAFLREMLQNAIDTVLARERIHGAFPDPRVDVTCWEDAEGFSWVRIDDNGMGMDERLLRDYFLRVGRSYYTSAEFEAQLVRKDQQKRFVPISRFGIGVLSCFLAGDRVEVSTRHLLRGGDEPETAEPLRLSVRRDRDFFVLRRKGQGVDDMPAGPRGERGFRRRAGTSIAVRIDPHRTGIRAGEIAAKVDTFVLAPPISVTVNGERVGRHADEELRAAWRAEPIVTRIDTADRKADTNGFPYLGHLDVVSVPLDLDRTSTVTGVGGKLTALLAMAAPPEGGNAEDLLSGWPEQPDGVATPLSDAVASTRCHIDLYSPTFAPSIEIDVVRPLRSARMAEALEALNRYAESPVPVLRRDTESSHVRALLDSPVSFRAALAALRVQSRASFSATYEELGIPHLAAFREREGRTRWSHHGIVLPAGEAHGPLFGSVTFSDAVLMGVLTLGGALRPDLNVSRGAVRAVSFPLHSAIHLAVRLALRVSSAPAAAVEMLEELDLIGKEPGEPCTIATVRTDPLVAGGSWNDEDVISTSRGRTSVNALLAAAARGKEIVIHRPFRAPWGRNEWSFFTELEAALLHLFVPLELVPGPGNAYLTTRQGAWSAMQISELLRPLYAVPFRAPATVAMVHGYFNAAHPLVTWISDHAAPLARDFPIPFRQLTSANPASVGVEGVNAALKQVRDARTDIPEPPPEAYLEADENGWWVSRD